MEAQSAESADVRAADEREQAIYEALLNDNSGGWLAGEEPLTALGSLAAEVRRLRAALEVYADARHWAIGRDDLRYRAVMWIGPGAERRGLPDAMETARAALAATTGSGAQAAPPEKS